MGQYYKLVNIDKREIVEPWAIGCGAKLMEWSYCRAEMACALMNLMAENWKGDRVYVVGDYAEADDPKEPFYKALADTLREIGAGDLYGYASEKFRNITGNVDTEFKDWQYIYNHETKQYIDLRQCPVEWAWCDTEKNEYFISKVAPLPLLLAMGNGRGGGDYHSNHHNYDLVGSWCDSVKSIEITDGRIKSLDYKLFAPDFTENEPMIPYTAADKVIAEEMKRRAAQNG